MISIFDMMTKYLRKKHVKKKSWSKQNLIPKVFLILWQKIEGKNKLRKSQQSQQIYNNLTYCIAFP
jgi:hypothetical protein